MGASRLRVFLVCLMLFLFLIPTLSLAEGYAQLMDRSGDDGRLTARFLWMDTFNEEKSGDCAILTSPDGKVMLIDAGEPTAAEYVVRALETMGISRVDFLVASHPHIDHVGGMPAVIRRFEIGAAYMSPVEYPSEPNDAFMAALQERGIPVVRLSRGDKFMFGESVLVDVLSPTDDIVYYDGYPEGSTQFLNDLSLVMKLSFNGSTMLFAGDLYLQGEKGVVEQAGSLKADLLKVNHHGDDTSSGKTWRTAVSPKVAVIMHNGMASLRVPVKFMQEGVRVFHTFLDGCVKVSTPGGGDLAVEVERERSWNFP